MKKNNNNNDIQIPPLSLCNFEKTNKINQNISERNFPLNKMPISYDFRPNNTYCKNDINHIINQQKQSTTIVNEDYMDNLNKTFHPGKGSYYGYCKSINIESELKNIKVDSKCPSKKYQADLTCLKNNTENKDYTQENNNLPTQILKKNQRTCNQNFADINGGIHNDNYSKYPSSFDIDNNVGIINNSNQEDKNIINGNMNLCMNTKNAQDCKNNNYMKGNFIASAVSDIRGQQQGFKNINNGENRWIEYQKLTNKNINNLDIVKNDFNTRPFELNQYGVINDNYLSNKQQCHNLYNNITKSKCLYGKPLKK